MRAAPPEPAAAAAPLEFQTVEPVVRLDEARPPRKWAPQDEAPRPAASVGPAAVRGVPAGAGATAATLDAQAPAEARRDEAWPASTDGLQEPVGPGDEVGGAIPEARLPATKQAAARREASAGAAGP